MGRLCERPGCSQPAEVAYRIEPDQLSVWLGLNDSSGADEPNLLCGRHADAMVVPLGWSLDDQREPVPRLFRPPAPVAAVASSRPPSRRATPSAGAAQPGSAQPGPAQLDFGDDEPPPVGEWRPVFDESDDLGGLLQAHSPLLARAFGGAPRESAPQ